MNTPEKCAHPSCTCDVKSDGLYGKYCSEYCKASSGSTELRCGCQHPTCR